MAYKLDVFTVEEKEAWERCNKLVNRPNYNFEKEKNDPSFYLLLKNFIKEKYDKIEMNKLKLEI